MWMPLVYIYMQKIAYTVMLDIVYGHAVLPSANGRRGWTGSAQNLSAVRKGTSIVLLVPLPFHKVATAAALQVVGRNGHLGLSGWWVCGLQTTRLGRYVVHGA